MKYILWYDHTYYDGCELDFLGIYDNEDSAKAKRDDLLKQSEINLKKIKDYETKCFEEIRKSWEKHRARVFKKQTHNDGYGVKDSLDIVTKYISLGHEVTNRHRDFSQIVNFNELEKIPELILKMPTRLKVSGPTYDSYRLHISECEYFGEKS